MCIWTLIQGSLLCNNGKDFYKTFNKRKVIMSKYLDLPFFSKERFPFVLILRTLKLDFLSTLNKPYSDDITRVFYSNLEPLDHLLRIQIEVCGFVLHLKKEDLARILKSRA